eukprot:sb/3470894/
MTRLLLCLLSVTLVAANSPDVARGESNRTLGSGTLGAGTCTGIDGSWVLAATKWDLTSAEVLEESTATIKSATINNKDTNSIPYYLESLVTISTDINLELPKNYFSAGPARHPTGTLGVGIRNVARGKAAYQSSTHHIGVAAKAVDGNRDGNFDHGSVSHTDVGSFNFWAVDLGKSHAIDCECYYFPRHSRFMKS